MKLLVAGLLVVIVVAAAVLAASLAPYLAPVLGTDGTATPTSAPTAAPTTAPTDTPTSVPVATPSGTAHQTVRGGSLPFTARFESDRALRAWTIRAEPTAGARDSEGEAAIVDGQLELRVFRCHRVVVERRLGRVDGRLRVSFDWATEAEEWYEYPDWHLVAPNGTTLDYTVTDGRDISRPNKSSERAGHLVAHASAATNVTLQFLIRPSQYCARSNHGNTTLRIDTVSAGTSSKTG